MSTRFSTRSRLFLVIGATLFIMNCSNPNTRILRTFSQAMEMDDSLQIVEVPVDFSDKKESFNLLGIDAVTAWSITVSGCADISDGTFNLENSTLKLILGAMGCYAKLNSLTIDNRDYILTDAALSVADWAVGQIRNYAVTGTSYKLRLKIVTPLPTEITADTTSLVFEYSGLDYQTEDASVAVESKTVSVTGYDANLFTLQKTQLVGIDGADSIFSFALACNTLVDAAPFSCDGIPLVSSRMKYRLVRNGAAATELHAIDSDITFSEVEQAFMGGTSLTEELNMVAAAGSFLGETLTNGGVKIISAGLTTVTNSNSSDGRINILDDYAFLIVGFDSNEDLVIDSYQYWKLTLNP